jgi:pyruvate/2-oxoacid:ferredoxin oxidoreductase alpha subunit
MCDLTIRAFELADRYRNPTVVLADGALGQMMEPVLFPESPAELPAKPWAVIGDAATRPNLVSSIYLQHEEQEAHINKLERKYEELGKTECRWQEYETNDAEILLVSYGITSRVARAAVEIARSRGIRAGLLRPQTLYPFPVQKIHELAGRACMVLVVELSTGQLMEDVRLAVNGLVPVQLFSRTGGVIPTAEDLVSVLKKLESECVGNYA